MYMLQISFKANTHYNISVMQVEVSLVMKGTVKKERYGG
jgi:hypothetical protein